MATVLVAVDEVYVQYAYALNGVDNEFMASCDRRPWCQCTPCSPCPMSRCPNSMAGRKLHGHVWAYSDAYDAEGVLEESKVLAPLAARQAGAVRGKILPAMVGMVPHAKATVRPIWCTNATKSGANACPNGLVVILDYSPSNQSPCNRVGAEAHAATCQPSQNICSSRCSHCCCASSIRN